MPCITNLFKLVRKPENNLGSWWVLNPFPFLENKCWSPKKIIHFPTSSKFWAPWPLWMALGVRETEKGFEFTTFFRYFVVSFITYRN